LHSSLSTIDSYGDYPFAIVVVVVVAVVVVEGQGGNFALDI